MRISFWFLRESLTLEAIFVQIEDFFLTHQAFDKQGTAFCVK